MTINHSQKPPNMHTITNSTNAVFSTQNKLVLCLPKLVFNHDNRSENSHVVFITENDDRFNKAPARHRDNIHENSEHRTISMII